MKKLKLIVGHKLDDRVGRTLVPKQRGFPIVLDPSFLVETNINQDSKPDVYIGDLEPRPLLQP